MHAKILYADAFALIRKEELRERNKILRKQYMCKYLSNLHSFLYQTVCKVDKVDKIDSTVCEYNESDDYI